MRKTKASFDMKPFDDLFSEKVREVFDHHEEAFDPASWNMMEKRLIGKRKAKVILFSSVLAKVAASLLLLSVLTWTAFRMLSPPTTLITEKPLEAETVIKAPETPYSNDTSEHNDLQDENSTTKMATKNLRIHESIVFFEADTASEQKAQVVYDQALYNNTEEMADVLDKHADESLTINLIEPDIINVTNQYDAARNQQTAISMEDDFAAKENAFSWGVSAGSVFTYAKQKTDGQIGFSAGVTSEYKISDRIRLASGIILAYQQFKVEGVPIYSKANYMNRSSESVSDHVSISTQADHSFEILAFDIPLNIRFHFPVSAKRNWQFSTGLSSLLYLQQNISGTEIAYAESSWFDPTTSSLRSETFASTVVVDTRYEPFSRFDFARILNLSLGYAIQGERTTAIIEPFVKLPLASLSSREIKMGMGGISLRLSFGK